MKYTVGDLKRFLKQVPAETPLKRLTCQGSFDIRLNEKDSLMIFDNGLRVELHFDDGEAVHPEQKYHFSLAGWARWKEKNEKV